MDRTGNWLRVAVGTAAALLIASAGFAAQGADATNWLSAAPAAPGTEKAATAEAEKPTTAPATAPAPEKAAEWTKPFPISFGVDYTVVSDYIWRGLNFSEYAGERREKLNHQVNLSFSIDTKDLCGKGSNFGVFGGSIWFEWFAGQEHLTPWSDNNLQEVDYSAYWKYAIEKIGTTVELGWIDYTYPRIRDKGSHLSADLATTQDLYVKLSFDDSLIFGGSKPVLNPYIAYYQDIDLVKAGWLEMGVSHDFALKDFGCEKMCILKDLTITPSLVLGVDHRYYDKAGYGGGGGPATRLGNLNYGLTFSYDLSGALGMPAQCGSIALKGFLNYSQAFHNESPLVHDEFYGGMTVSYSW